VRRQHPIGRYVADFAIMCARLAIEIDGPLHEGTKDADAERDAAFAILGWRVLRFTPQQVLEGPSFLAAVRAALTPSPRGEGAGGEVNHQRSQSKAITPEHKSEDIEAPLTPQPPLLAERGSEEFAPHLLRRTRANRKLPPRRKT
jgi:hypothetical protein